MQTHKAEVTEQKSNPLRGSVLRYERPLELVAEQNWQASAEVASEKTLEEEVTQHDVPRNN